ncbi:hypothetical protein GCM10023084_72530 [Streptomyces lacrimifluminis]|uniref:Uncharacterized protein n=1 Tax=Streptomyces lacrimifluminis TaxID=1500077 RepID=A0A917UK48_9ACTN|nr:hypothetical protein [Streptomyces lacrimifluminis]GGJ63277.1 hypothetical protein GCM10012282_70610 [Streptomyces lacrimifluminis]
MSVRSSPARSWRARTRRSDRVLHEALSVGADPLHLALVFNLSHTAASRYATIAQNLLDNQIEQTNESE